MVLPDYWMLYMHQIIIHLIWRINIIMYPYMTLNDDTEITHSEMKSDGIVKVYIETPDKIVCFRHATCWLPEYKWEDIYAYTDEEIEYFSEIIESMSHLILEFSQKGGFTNAPGFLDLVLIGCIWGQMKMNHWNLFMYIFHKEIQVKIQQKYG